MHCVSQSVKETLTSLTKASMKRTERGQRESFTYERYVVHCYVRSDGLGGTVTTDAEYPARVAFVLVGLLLEELITVQGDTWQAVTTPDSVSFPPMVDYLRFYRDPGAPAAVEKATTTQKGVSTGQGLTLLPECAHMCILQIDSLPGVFADTVCPSNQQIRRSLRLGICALFLCSMFFSIGVLTGYVLTFYGYALLADSIISRTGLYFNSSQDLSASLPSDFIALCPSYICGFHTQGAQCYCDAAGTYITVDGQMLTSTVSNEQPPYDSPVQAKQA